jgi:site-specific DNA-methyltransferase (adenine-specific)
LDACAGGAAVIVREERIGDCRLILGDSLSVIPSLDGVDCVVGDPPYSSGGFTQSAISKAKGQGLRSETLKKEGWFSGDAMTAAGAAFLLREIALACYRISGPKSTLTFFTDWRVLSVNAPAIESALWRFQNLLVWDKGSAGMGSGFRAQHEMAMHFSKGSPEYFCSSFGNVMRARRVPPGKKYHGCEKPMELMGAIIRTVCPPGGVVLDPFMGSGTTIAAAVQKGCSGIGIELDPEHFEAACKRVEGSYKSRPLISQEGPQFVQSGLDL